MTLSWRVGTVIRNVSFCQAASLNLDPI